MPALIKPDRIQIDIIDGKFADNKTIEPSILGELNTSLKIDYHLMVNEPVDWVKRCVSGMADRIIGQVEKMSNQVAFIEAVSGVGAKVGLALDLDTPVSTIDPSILTDLDVVLVMSVPAGFGGQKFKPIVLDKIAQLDKLRENDRSPFYICDDGGVSVEYIDDVRCKGVDEVVIGASLFEGDLGDNVERYIRAAYGK